MQSGSESAAATSLEPGFREGNDTVGPLSPLTGPGSNVARSSRFGIYWMMSCGALIWFVICALVWWLA